MPDQTELCCFVYMLIDCVYVCMCACSLINVGTCSGAVHKYCVSAVELVSRTTQLSSRGNHNHLHL